jgi:hypothetical protein
VLKKTKDQGPRVAYQQPSPSQHLQHKPYLSIPQELPPTPSETASSIPPPSPLSPALHRADAPQPPLLPRPRDAGRHAMSSAPRLAQRATTACCCSRRSPLPAVRRVRLCCFVVVVDCRPQVQRRPGGPLSCRRRPGLSAVPYFAVVAPASPTAHAVAPPSAGRHIYAASLLPPSRFDSMLFDLTKQFGPLDLTKQFDSTNV